MHRYLLYFVTGTVVQRMLRHLLHASIPAILGYRHATGRVPSTSQAFPSQGSPQMSRVVPQGHHDHRCLSRAELARCPDGHSLLPHTLMLSDSESKGCFQSTCRLSRPVLSLSFQVAVLHSQHADSPSQLNTLSPQVPGSPTQRRSRAPDLRGAPRPQRDPSGKLRIPADPMGGRGARDSIRPISHTVSRLFSPFDTRGRVHTRRHIRLCAAGCAASLCQCAVFRHPRVRPRGLDRLGFDRWAPTRCCPAGVLLLQSLPSRGRPNGAGYVGVRARTPRSRRRTGTSQPRHAPWTCCRVQDCKTRPHLHGAGAHPVAQVDIRPAFT
ncbi:hypothetical protein C8T65DRAFT_28049 [Cerioporus squamosus]|nr:hypothetical protein C8T65DRAFT_28049 [Cerioporus squamosus]